MRAQWSSAETNLVYQASDDIIYPLDAPRRGEDFIPSDTRWEDWKRFSGRQKQAIHLGGLVGHMTYQGNWQPFLPFLPLTEWIQVGKGTVFGNGQVVVVGHSSG